MLESPVFQQMRKEIEDLKNEPTENYFKTLQDVLHNSKLTIYNLLDNINIEGYKRISYYKEEEHIVCELICEEKNNKAYNFYYYFKKDSLEKILVEENGITKIFFSKEVLLKDLEKVFEEIVKKMEDWDAQNKNTVFETINYGTENDFNNRMYYLSCINITRKIPIIIFGIYYSNIYCLAFRSYVYCYSRRKFLR